MTNKLWYCFSLPGQNSTTNRRLVLLTVNVSACFYLPSSVFLLYWPYVNGWSLKISKLCEHFPWTLLGLSVGFCSIAQTLYLCIQWRPMTCIHLECHCWVLVCSYFVARLLVQVESLCGQRVTCQPNFNSRSPELIDNFWRQSSVFNALVVVNNNIAMSPGRVGFCVRLGFFLNADVVNHSWFLVVWVQKGRGG